MKTALAGLLTLISLSIYANEVKTIQGVIGEYECNSTTGLGIVNVSNKVGKVMEVRTYKVNSTELCRPNTGHISQLGDIAIDNLIVGEIHNYELTLTNDYVTAVKKLKKLDAYKFNQVSEVRHINRNQMYRWFFEEVKGIYNR